MSINIFHKVFESLSNLRVPVAILLCLCPVLRAGPGSQLDKPGTDPSCFNCGNDLTNQEGSSWTWLSSLNLKDFIDYFRNTEKFDIFADLMGAPIDDFGADPVSELNNTIPRSLFGVPIYTREGEGYPSGPQPPTHRGPRMRATSSKSIPIRPTTLEGLGPSELSAERLSFSEDDPQYDPRSDAPVLMGVRPINSKPNLSERPDAFLPIPEESDLEIESSSIPSSPSSNGQSLYKDWGKTRNLTISIPDEDRSETPKKRQYKALVAVADRKAMFDRSSLRDSELYSENPRSYTVKEQNKIIESVLNESVLNPSPNSNNSASDNDSPRPNSDGI